MQLGCSEATTLKPHRGNAFHLSPMTGSELLSEPHDLSNPTSNGDRLYISDLSDNLEMQCTSLLRRTIRVSGRRAAKRSGGPARAARVLDALVGPLWH